MAELGVGQIRRRKPAVLQAVENLDAFPKVPDTCEEKTSYGGTASITALILILWLSMLEINYYLDSEYTFHFSPDVDMDSKLSINVDITVAMPCGIIGADIVDSTNQNVIKFGELEEEYVHFQLSDRQRAYFQAKAGFNSYFREEYHSLNKILWKNAFLNSHAEMPQLTRGESYELGTKEACRLHGKLELNKVAGNFHVTAGKTLPLPRGHAHIAAFMSERDYNFTHRISKFSFGEGTPGIVLPLEGDEKVTTKNQMVFHYFIQVVPTIVKTRFKSYQTYQYSVREFSREINHDQGSHGISGIFFKYEMSGLKVEVIEESESLLEFVIRLCAIIGGVYATIGMIYNHLSFFGCKFHWLKEPKRNVNRSVLTSIDNGSEVKSRLPTVQNPILQPSFQTANVDFVHPQVHSQIQYTDTFVPSSEPTTNSQNTPVTITGPVGGILPDLLSSHATL